MYIENIIKGNNKYMIYMLHRYADCPIGDTLINKAEFII